MRRIFIAAAVTLVLAATTTAAAADRADPRTPCEAARLAVSQIRQNAAAGGASSVAYIGRSYGYMLRQIAAGHFEDVHGPVSPDLHAALFTLAGSLEDAAVSPTVAEDEFSFGEMGVQIAAVFAACPRQSR